MLAIAEELFDNKTIALSDYGLLSPNVLHKKYFEY